MNKSTKRLAIGTVLSGVAGYAMGILMAPKSGAETRDSLRHASKASVAEIEKQLKFLHTELNNLINQIDESTDMTSEKNKGDRLSTEIIARAAKTRQKTRETLSFLHDGIASDKDLDNAVHEARNAIKSLRKYLNK